MPTYEIEQNEMHTTKYRVEAANPAEAIAKLFAGRATPVDDSQEFIEVMDDFGLPAEEFPELAKALDEHHVTLDDGVIPSIRSIVEVPPTQLSNGGRSDEDHADRGT